MVGSVRWVNTRSASRRFRTIYGGIRMKSRMVASLLAVVTSVGCTGGDAARLVTPGRTTRSRALDVSEDLSSARSGSLIVRKECHLYTGKAGDICTITESNVKEIE